MRNNIANFMNPKQCAAAIVGGLKKAGIDFVATLPDEKMVEVVRAVHVGRQVAGAHRTGPPQRIPGGADLGQRRAASQ